MKGDEKVIDFLNEALKNELTAINQYWLHYRMLDNWGVAKLAHFERHESIDEMKHADRLSERILFNSFVSSVVSVKFSIARRIVGRKSIRALAVSSRHRSIR